MKAIVVGATGATGRELLQLLLADSRFSQVDVFVRRDPSVQHAKLSVHKVDFDQPESWQHLVRGDVLFSCMGTTLKAAGSQAAQWKIDYGYQYAFAQAARANQVACCVLVSSGHASSQSRFFYPRMKGQLEEAVRELAFSKLLIFRPPVLVRPNSDRAGEVWGVRILRWLNRMGLFAAERPMPTRVLAQALVHAIATEGNGTFVFESSAIWDMWQQAEKAGVHGAHAASTAKRA